jgi:peptide/nickel transport system substrate-binding protein
MAETSETSKNGNSRRDFLRLAGISSAGLTLAACGTPPAPGTDGAPSPTASASKGAAKPEPTPSGRAVPRGKPKQVPREQSLVISYGDGTDVGIGNPMMSGFNHQRGMACLLEPLYYYGAFSGETTPWLADGEPTYSDDNKTMTLTTREGAKWSDGEAFDAEDVAYTLNMLRDPDNAAMPYSADMHEWVKDAKADGRELTVTFLKPAPRFAFDFLTFKNDLGIFLIPEHIFKDIKKPVEFPFYDPNKGWPISTGAYKLVDWTVQQRLMDRRDDWWASTSGFAPAPGPTRVIVVPWADANTGAQQLITNELDSSLDLRPPVIKQVVAENEAIQTWTGRDAPYGYTDWWPQMLWFNNQTGPFTDLDLRKAINHCIDRQQLVDIGYEGAGAINTLPFPDFPPLHKYFDALADLVAKYPMDAHDLGAAEQIMTGKGYAKNNKGLWAKDGKVLDATIYGMPDLSTDYGPILAEQLRKGGFSASHQAPADTWTRMANGAAKMFLVGNAGAIKDPYPTLYNMVSKNVAKPGVAGNTNARWVNKDFDAIIEKMGQLPVDDPEELPLFVQAMEIYFKEMPYLPLVQWLHRVPLNTKYFTGWPTADDPWLPAAFWFKTFGLELTRLKPVSG